jgi:hypothetical protein
MRRNEWSRSSECAANPKDLARLAKLLTMHAAETAMIVRLATKLRLTPQSSADARTPKRDPAAGLRKPWEILADDPEPLGDHRAQSW